MLDSRLQHFESVNILAKGERKVQMQMKTSVLVDNLKFPEQIPSS
ncbi:MAG: hypothetical protein NVSMB27_36950 [Ktedonobacteraceae bacterium]